MKCLVIACLLLMGCTSVPQEDRSFFQYPDKNDWPGDALSEKQFDRAVGHFHMQNDPCGVAPKWALIGPNTLLLIGTDYQVVRVPSGGGYVPNVRWSKGYWGGQRVIEDSIIVAKFTVEQEFRLDCQYGHK